MALNIPSRLQPIVADIYKWKDPRRQELLEALKAVKPGSSFETYRRKLVELYPEQSAEWIDNTLHLVFSITNIVDTSKDAEAVSRDFIEAFQKTNKEDATEAEEGNLDKFKAFILAIAQSQDLVGLGAKAARVRMQYERIFVYSEIFSDIRTIFGQSGPEDRPNSAVIMHLLEGCARFT